jgi:hypothetical protein
MVGQRRPFVHRFEPARSGSANNLMPERSRRAPLARRAVAWTIGWAFSAALYLLLIDTTDLPELIVGAGAAVLAATGLELAREQGLVGESVHLRWLLRFHKPLMKVAMDMALVSATALRALLDREAAQGRFRAVPFTASEDQQHESGRRALAEALGSFAPNTVVAGIDEERGLILAHQLWQRGGREAVDPMELG